eukprot:GHVU01110172.1.p2 GENE.GHVU01110172.1~~GHVU01110172.1.p2  ORF type:complete len:103 (-),score=4.92 GHVU01110172.1:341-649(-)
MFSLSIVMAACRPPLAASLPCLPVSHVCQSTPIACLPGSLVASTCRRWILTHRHRPDVCLRDSLAPSHPPALAASIDGEAACDGWRCLTHQQHQGEESGGHH